MKSESTATITGPETETYEALAVEVRALGREHRLPEAFVAKTLDQLRDAVAMPPRLAAALIEQILAKVRTQVLAARRKRAKPRGPYRTLEQLRLLAIVGKTPGLTTSEVAREAAWGADPTEEPKVSRQITARSLAALQAQGLVVRHARKDNPKRRVWYLRKTGSDALNELPEVKRGLAKADEYGELVAIVESRLKLRDELRGAPWNWSYNQIRDVLPFHAVSYIRRQMAEMKRLEKRGIVWSPSSVLWFRLGTEPRAMKEARVRAVKLFTDPKLRVAYVERMREEAKRQVFEKRKQGIARLHLPPGLAQAYLAATKDEPFYIAVQLAFSLREMAKKGLTVTLGDLNGVLHEIRKEVQKRPRLPLDEDGEPRCGPRGPSPP